MMVFEILSWSFQSHCSRTRSMDQILRFWSEKTAFNLNELERHPSENLKKKVMGEFSLFHSGWKSIAIHTISYKVSPNFQVHVGKASMFFLGFWLLSIIVNCRIKVGTEKPFKPYLSSHCCFVLGLPWGFFFISFHY